MRRAARDWPAGNTALPAHNGIIITRSLQEWACLLPQELPFASVARLLGWQTQDEHSLSDTTIRSLVRTHGQIIRQAEQAEVTALTTRDDVDRLTLQVIPHDQPRRRVVSVTGLYYRSHHRQYYRDRRQ